MINQGCILLLLSLCGQNQKIKYLFKHDHENVSEKS